MLDFRMDTFLAVCRHRNYTRAAEELNITRAAERLYISQQSLSNHISNIPAWMSTCWWKTPRSCCG